MVLLLASILLGWLAFHLRRLDQQDAAIEFLDSHNCQTFIGEYEDMHVVVTRTVSQNMVNLGREKQFYFIAQIKPKSNAVPPTGFLAQLTGPRFFNRKQIVWLAQDGGYDIEELVRQLRNLPWLKCIVLETVLGNRGITDTNFVEFKADQTALTELQIERIKSEFPNLQIQKSMFEAAAP